MRTNTLALALSLALVTPGCGLIVRGSDYLADAGQSSMDANVDGDVPDGDVPRDGEPPPIDGEIPGEDGGPDAGPPVNRPPVASGVGLSDHAPFLGETLRAFVGPVYDADGDGVVTALAWFKNGEVIAGATGQTLELDPTRFAIGDDIRVELSTSDADGPGSTAVSGVAVIGADDVTTWRNLLPPRRFSNMRAFDHARQRLLFWSQGGNDVVADHGLWEMQLVTSGTPRWVRVDQQGTLPEAVEALTLYDAANHRVLYYGGRIPESSGDEDTTDAVFALDLTNRGRETWSQISVTAPPGRQAASVALSADGTRAWIYGGLYNEGGSGGLRDDVWELDLADASFTMIGASTGSPAVGAALIHDPERNRLIRVGGGPLGGEGPMPDDEIGVIDLATGAYTALGTLPSPLLGASAVVEGDSAYIFFGATSGLAASTKVLVMPLSDPTEITEVEVPDAPFAILPSSASRAPFADGHVVWGQGLDDRNADFYELDPTTASFTVITAAGHDLPTPTMQATSHFDRDGRMEIYGGRQGTREDEDIPVPNYLWQVTQNDVFERVTVFPAPTGGSNEPRWGIVSDGSQEHPWPEIWQLLGRTGTGYYGPEPVLLAGEGWAHLDLPDGAPGPDGRVGHAVFPGSCAETVSGVTRGNVVGLFGGEHPESPQTFDDTWMLSCDLPPSGAPTNCTWSNGVISALSARPSARAWAASALAGHNEGERNRLVFVFGGRSASGGALDDLWIVDSCVSPSAPGGWTRGVSSSSPLPNPRWGHSMSHVRVAAGAPAADPSTILMYGGGQDEYGRSNHPDVWRIVPIDRTGTDYSVRYEHVTTTGVLPIGRMYHVAAWDHVQRRLLVYGGYAGERALDDLWELRVRP